MWYKQRERGFATEMERSHKKVNKEGCLIFYYDMENKGPKSRLLCVEETVSTVVFIISLFSQVKVNGKEQIELLSFPAAFKYTLL